MLQEGNYDVLRFPMPTEGMNQFLSPEVLPPNFSYYLENILPTPFGSGQVRYGTKLIYKLDDANLNILKAFRFVKEDGNVQAVIYAQSYSEDGSVEDAAANGQITLTFISNEHADRYIENTQIMVSYSLNGANYTFFPNIQEVTINEDVNVEILLGQNFFPNSEDIEIQSISYSVGQIYVYDFFTSSFTEILKNDLSVACIPRAEIFQKKLVICNGVDKLLSWDGDNLEEVVDFVKETQANTFNRVDDHGFTFNSLAGFDANKYFIGNLIQLKINQVINQFIIHETIIVGQLVTIVVENPGVVPAFGAEDVIELFYQDWPPPFNYLFAGKDRIWALGPGPAGIKWRDSNEALRVYYPYMPNSLTNWFNENTKTVPSIDISDKHGIQDNLEAICQVNGLLAFVGRSRTQVWSGSIPDVNGVGGDLRWQANVDAGVIHGDLLIPISNDVYFISQSGLQSASTLNIAQQFAATSYNAVDPIINEFLSDIMSSDVDYRSCRSFKYEQGAFGGFKIGRNKLLVSLFETNFYAWTFFSGDFQRSNTFLDTGESLCLFIGNSIYQYADGNDGFARIYGDKDGSSFISFAWVPGLIKFGGKRSRRFANKRYQLILNYPSSFVVNDKNTVTLTINGLSPKTYEMNDELEFQEKGDVLGSAAFGDFRLGVDCEFVKRKLKFASSEFWVRLNGYTVNGPLSFKELKFFGVGERNG